jgi:hypothetical protein
MSYVNIYFVINCHKGVLLQYISLTDRFSPLFYLESDLNLDIPFASAGELCARIDLEPLDR